jgi:hypothetical protein
MARALVLVGFVLAGCFRPVVENGGFSCLPTDDPACPEGYVCVAGLCVEVAEADDAAVPADAAAPADARGAAGDLGDPDLARPARDSSTGTPDLSLMTPPDFATEPPDFATTPPDFATAPPDFSTTPPDLAHRHDLSQPPLDLTSFVCEHAGGPCTTPDVCCSNYCRTDGICIGG